MSAFKDSILQFLTFGYDNAQHLGLYKVYLNEMTFPFSISNNWTNDFGLFRDYPPGHALFTSYFARIFFIETSSNLNLVLSYFLIGIGIFVACLLSSLNVLKLIERKKIGSFQSLALLLLLLYPWGVLYTNGFGPYLLGIAITLLVLIGNHHCETFVQRLSIQILGTGLLLITTPSMVFCFIPSLILLVKDNVTSIAYAIKSKEVLASTAFGLITLYSYFQTSNNFGWRQLLGDGGIQPPRLLYAALISLISFIFMARLRHRENRNTFAYVTLSLLVSTLALIILNLIFTASINYYAVKQFYVYCGFISIYFIRLYYSRNFKVSRIFLVSFILIAMLGIVKPKQYTGAFMGHLWETITAATLSNDWQDEIVDARSIWKASEIRSKFGDTCLIYHVGRNQVDLNSRWLNAIGNPKSITQDCFMSFWNKQNVDLNSYLNSLPRKLNFIVFISESDNTMNDDRPNNLMVKRAWWEDRS